MLLYIQFKTISYIRFTFYSLPIFLIFSLRTRSHLRKDNHRLSSESQKIVISTPNIGIIILRYDIMIFIGCASPAGLPCLTVSSAFIVLVVVVILLPLASNGLCLIGSNRISIIY